MEFLVYADALPAIEKLGIRTEEHDEMAHFTIADENASTISIGPDSTTSDPAHPNLDAASDDLPRMCDQAFHALNINEVILVPRTSWKKVLELTAFDLATVEKWLDIDAEASLHQNTRDPLFVSRDEHEILETMVRSLLTNAETASQSIAVLASGRTPLLVDVLPPDRLRVQCVGDGVAERITDYLRKVG